MDSNYKTAFFITLALLIITGFLFLGYIIFTTIAFMGMRSNKLDNTVAYKNMQKVQDSTSESGSSTSSTSKVSADNLYQNTDFRFRFDLREGEQVVNCPNENEYNNNVVAFITKEKGASCNAGGPNEYISAGTLFGGNKDGGMADFIIENYDFRAVDYDINGITGGVRYTGEILPNKIAPMPENIDLVILTKNDISYTITSDFYDRNVVIY